MKYSVTVALLTVYYVVAGVFCVAWAVKAINATPTLPCTVSEISPDFSQADREKCRIIRSRKL